MNKIWSDLQCKNLGSYRFNLTKCKEKCLSTEVCTAINHKGDQPGETQDCILRACSSPVPSPTLEVLDYQGYHLASSKI